MKNEKLIIKLYREHNYSRKAVEDSTGLTEGQINHVLKNNPHLADESKQYREKLKAQREAQVVDLLKEGKSIRYICRMVKIDPSRVYAIRIDNGLTPKPKKEKKPKYYVPFWPY